MRGINQTRPGFTLLEVLIAVGVLFIIGSSVVSFSNNLIQGTVRSADTTVTNLWAEEGLEILSKIRDDNFRSPSSEESGDPSPWLAAAKSTSQYGWHQLVAEGTGWKLEKLIGLGNDLPMSAAYQAAVEQKVSAGLVAKRLICVEAVGASSRPTGSNVRCNTDNDGATITSDGDRSVIADCAEEDVYCNATKASLNRNNADQTVIPAGNAVKVRTVLVWPHRGSYRSSSMAMFLTNWRSYDQ